MHLGFVPVLSGSGGGIHQYSLTMLRSLMEIVREGRGHELAVFANDLQHPEVVRAGAAGCSIHPLFPPTLKWKLAAAVQRCVGEDRAAEWWTRRQFAKAGSRSADGVPEISVLPDPARSWFARCGAELMLFPWSSTLAFESGVPYIFTIHDLNHRRHSEFPEVSADGEWERREYRYRNGIRHATLLIADSETGKEDILEFYGDCGATAGRIKVLPYRPVHAGESAVSEDERERVRELYGLPPRFIFYPAQFWPHKNHQRVVEALALLRRDRGLQVETVFCGSHGGRLRAGTYRKVMDTARTLGIRSQVHSLGYVPEGDMPGLYAAAEALVMPTFFGTTHLPFLDAWSSGCPVVTSDLRGIREQVGDAAVRVDPASVESIADGLQRFWREKTLRHDLLSKGQRRLSRYTSSDYREKLEGILQEAGSRMIG